MTIKLSLIMSLTLCTACARDKTQTPSTPNTPVDVCEDSIGGEYLDGHDLGIQIYNHCKQAVFRDCYPQLYDVEVIDSGIFTITTTTTSADPRCMAVGTHTCTLERIGDSLNYKFSCDNGINDTFWKYIKPPPDFI